MKFDYVDIGTSDFDTSSGPGKVLLVEPLLHYLANIPNGEFTYKANFAISDRSGWQDIYHVPPAKIEQYGLPFWVRGCNSLGKPHHTIENLMQSRGLSGSEIVEVQSVRTITFADLLNIYDVDEIGVLKIDTEGHDHIVLDSVIKSLHLVNITKIICEYIPSFGNTADLDERFKTLENFGFVCNPSEGDNVTLTKRSQPKRRPRIVFFTHNEWAFGSIHYELIKYLHPFIDSVLMPWNIGYSKEEFRQLNNVTDLFVTAPDALSVLIQNYGIEPDKISIVGHGLNDFHRFLKVLPEDYMQKVKSFGVVSERLKNQVMELGFSREPEVINLGINVTRFAMEPAKCLTTVGYAGKFDHILIDSNVDVKRSVLAEKVTTEAGLKFKIAEGSHQSFISMPGFYNEIDCLIVPSLEEAAGLPSLEAGAAGRLVITTPVGHSDFYDLGGAGGINVSVDENNFVAQTVEILEFYGNNPEEFQAKCKSIQKHAKENYGWENLVDKWVKFLS